MSWILEKEFHFEASHILPHHDGKCARLHGHSWKGRLICKGDQLHESGSKSGMLVDFADMKSAIKPLLDEYLDHYHLNDSLKLESPTSELVAQWIFRKVKTKLPELSAVIIEETCTSLCRYEESK
jgi:6-pyruvoyltetrahydropterin/6-carboxytetrahydropterin synthase